MMECYLDRLDIELADGNQYTFRELDIFDERTIDLFDGVAKLDSDKTEEVKQGIKAVKELLSFSLSFDQDEETIKGLFAKGLLTLNSKNPKQKERMESILGFIRPKSEGEDESETT